MGSSSYVAPIFHVQWREPIGLADAGCPSFALSWASKKEQRHGSILIQNGGETTAWMQEIEQRMEQ